jgi:hypothetical protein
MEGDATERKKGSFRGRMTKGRNKYLKSLPPGVVFDRGYIHMSKGVSTYPSDSPGKTKYPSERKYLGGIINYLDLHFNGNNFFLMGNIPYLYRKVSTLQVNRSTCTCIYPIGV